MAFYLSPGVYVKEIDLTNIIPAVATSTGATVGEFAWGPVEEIVVLNDEQDLISNFGKPNDTNFRDWMSAANFLAYARNLHLVRCIGSDAKNANASATGSETGRNMVKNLTDYENTSFSAGADLFVAKYPGALGNSIKVSWVDATAFNAVDSNNDPAWDYHDQFDTAPDAGEYHIVVVDADGKITGEAETILERFAYVTNDEDSFYEDGRSSYWANVFKDGSRWLWAGNTSLWDDTGTVTLGGGADGTTPTNGERIAAWVLFQNAEEVDISLVFASNASKLVSKWIIDNVAELRKDCVAFVSPEANDIVGLASVDTILDNIIDTRNYFGSSNYAFMDGNYKYQYDRFNDKNRWVPLNGDMAGIAARSDFETDPWWSFAGLNRGRLKNVIRFSFTPKLSYRDELYKNGVNPVLTFPNDGPVLFGDKTLQAKPSAFDRINVRRLFIVLEKAIAKAARYLLFEFNDEFTRNQFINMVEPFLRDVQGRRGIYDFRVICDESNNTGEVIDRNEFVGDIYIKPARSINFIVLNFVAVRTAVAFEEVLLTNANAASNIAGT